jgi:hypothetical protein
MSETTLTKLYVAEVHTTAYSVFFGALKEEALEEILQKHAEHELRTFESWYKDAGFEDEDEIGAGIHKLRRDTAPWYEIQKWLGEYYDLFRSELKIIRVTNLMVNQLWCVENYDFAGSAMNEYIPAQIWTSNGEHVEHYKTENVGKQFSVSEVFIYIGNAEVVFEFPDDTGVFSVKYASDAEGDYHGGSPTAYDC